MNILLIAYYYEQPGSGGTARPRALLRHFTGAGHRVTVVTAGYRGNRRDGSKWVVSDPGCNGDRRGGNYPRWLARRLAVEALLRCGRYASVFGAWLRRAERKADEVLAAAAPHVILSTYPPAENLLLGLRLSRRSGVPLVAEFRDGLLFEPVERRATGFRAVRREYRELEAAVAREAAAVVTVSPLLSRYFQEQPGIRRAVTIPNGFDELPPLRPLEPDPFAPGCFHVVHTGGISLSDRACDLTPLVRGVETALAASPRLRERLRLHFAGRLNRRERRLLRPLEAAGIARLYGLLPRASALWLQGRADLLLLLAAPDRASVATAKLFEYMRSGRPVLAMAAGTFAAEIVSETGMGWIIAADSAAEVAHLLPRIMSGELSPPPPAPEAVERYARENQARAYISLLEQVRK